VIFDTPQGCPSCRSADLRDRGLLLDAVEFAGRPVETVLRGGKLWQCCTCALQFRFPALSQTELNSLYQAASADAWADTGAKRLDWELARSILDQASTGGSLLDLGCWDGRFLHSVEPRWNTHGIEMSPVAAERAAASGVKIVGNDIKDLASLDERFDVITAFDVIEHVYDPLQFLQNCAHVLRPGGQLIVATGNTQSLPWTLLGSRHLYCIWPEHLSFICPEWCKRNAASAALQMSAAIPYRRIDAGILCIASDIAKNVLYRAAPEAVSLLRRAGIGHVDHPVKYDYPLQWTTAKDHFLAVFRKA
jgi:SAM-dependent methyltransferase